MEESFFKYLERWIGVKQLVDRSLGPVKGPFKASNPVQDLCFQFSDEQIGRRVGFILICFVSIVKSSMRFQGRGSGGGL